MTQIPINLTADRLCSTLMSRAFEKARVSYFLGQGRVWSYPAILVIDDTESDKSLRPLARQSRCLATSREGVLE